MFLSQRGAEIEISKRDTEKVGCKQDTVLTMPKDGAVTDDVVDLKHIRGDWRGWPRGVHWEDRLAEAWVPREVFLDDCRMALAVEPSVVTAEMCLGLNSNQLPPSLPSGLFLEIWGGVFGGGMGTWFEVGDILGTCLPTVGKHTILDDTLYLGSWGD